MFPRACRTAEAPEAAHELLERLVEVARVFADAEAGHVAEGLLGGTGYAGFALEAEQKAYEAFVADLEHLATTRVPAVSASALARADRALNAAYRKALTAAEKPCPLCRETDHATRPQMVRAAQRAWIAYRDACAAFYAARWKGAAPPADLQREILHALTVARTRTLTESLG